MGKSPYKTLKLTKPNKIFSNNATRLDLSLIGPNPSSTFTLLFKSLGLVRFLDAFEIFYAHQDWNY